MVLSVGVLCLQPDVGIVAIMRGEGAAGHMARRLIVAAIGVPLVLGWVVSQGEMQGWYGRGFRRCAGHLIMR